MRLLTLRCPVGDGRVRDTCEAHEAQAIAEGYSLVQHGYHGWADAPPLPVSDAMGPPATGSCAWCPGGYESPEGRAWLADLDRRTRAERESRAAEAAEVQREIDDMEA